VRLITKEIVNQAILVDPAEHDGMVLSAKLITRNGAYSFRNVVRIKGGVAFNVPETGEMVMLDEEELIGLSVEASTILLHKHKVGALPELLVWAEKQRASARKRAP
jgi:hypothetical protein